ncbi:NAD-glutamate dehydrogenase [Arthrobacter sp. 35W]|uniref:NAD-glutamate dehydrogenase n=1 Tax=Arthrobacter sp. 35W TaxID=1132441 RepID=UPI0004049BB4|nr:NAD-glutamate dehydrogenase [Arthrobacter sp. 35W]
MTSHGRTGAPAPLEQFIHDYLQDVPAEDREPYGPGGLEVRAAAHYRAAANRGSGETLVGLIDGGPRSVLYVVADDKPFLVDSLLAECTRRLLGIQLVIHPIFAVDRDGNGALTGLHRPRQAHPAESAEPVHRESWITVEFQGRLAEDDAQALVAGVERVLADVDAAVADWHAMRRTATELADGLPQGVPASESAGELLRWLARDNFVFVGYREYSLVRGASVDSLEAVEGTGLGVLRAGGRPRRRIEGAARTAAREAVPVTVTKANARSTVHRDAHLDYISIKAFDGHGNVAGEHRFLGLFTASVYNGPARGIPVVADKIQAVVDGGGLDADSHSGRRLMSILEGYPRDELFQIGLADLAGKARGILALQERRRSHVFLREDSYGRFVTALVYIPTDRDNSDVRARIQRELGRAYDALAVDCEAGGPVSALARILFTIWLPLHGPKRPSEADLRQRVAHAARSWSEGILDALREALPEQEAEPRFQRWAEAFPAEYRIKFDVEEAREDINRFERLEQHGPASGALLRVDPQSGGDRAGRVRLYVRSPQSLTKILPYFEHLGLEVLNERPYEIVDADSLEFFIYDLSVVQPAGAIDVETLLPAAFDAVLAGEAESDVLNGLVLRQGIGWRLVAVLRCYARYWRQLGVSHSYEFVAATLQAYPAATAALLDLFAAKFDPGLDARDRAGWTAQADQRLSTSIEDVSTLDAAFVLDTFASLVRATVRTNFYQGKPHISVKFDPSGIDAMPLPRPAHEAWVYSPMVEGVHLRYGKTARGGLRWSDRQEDFRTEVLGLVKAQAVKNAVIIPDGAKGGFFAKNLPDASDRAGRLAAGQECYRTFIRGLLDITDNLEFDGDRPSVVAPPRVVRHDDDDSYLVVAADKGTAPFSDIANEVAQGYGFWLGDAFASGGSVGYDHKQMGITARGAWESVKVHFSELKIDPQTADFTAIGIGDMSGDVFGNGMLQSRHTRLVAAFDHRHIFLDPDPDARGSYEERERLFALPRSSWADYDSSLMSAGGGVWPRDARSVPLSPEVRKALGVDPAIESMSPPRLLQAILCAPVDLLYNGGIGTYVKAAAESHSDIGDRANDAIRVNGSALRARIVAEGGNLGLSQAGRIEAALNGVLINTDAIDNSAGVDCSDHEVNIKILVDQQIRAGRLAASERAAFLHSLTDEVAGLVLADNVAQNVLLLTDRRFSAASFPNYERLMQFLEERGQLDRGIEFLPSSEALRERIEQGHGLTSPELSILAAYAKNTLADSIRSSPLVQDAYFESALRGYFPQAVVSRFGTALDRHPLRDDIVATTLANDAINIGGTTAIFRLMEETSATEAEAIKSFAIASELFGLRELSNRLVHLPTDMPAEKWSRIHLDIRRVLDRAMRWFIQHDHGLPIADSVALYRPVVDGLLSHLPELLTGNDREETTHLLSSAKDWGLPETLARTWAELREAFTLLDIARVNQLTGAPLAAIAPVYYAVHERFQIENLLTLIDRLPRSSKWQAMARASLRDDLSDVAPQLTIAVLGGGASAAAGDQLSRWEALHHKRLAEAERLLQSAPENSFEALAAFISTLRKSAQA